MPSDIYVYLRTGPRNVLLNAVTATPTIVTQTIKSPPFRDLGFRSIGSAAEDFLLYPTSNTVPYTRLVASPDTFSVSVPDNVAHVDLRQSDLTVSFWKFETSDGIDKYFPAAEVLGWGDAELS